MTPSLTLTGNHPFAAWLAVFLAHRGWPLNWLDAPIGPEPNPEPDGWLGLSHMLCEPLGEPVPTWPLELCAQQLDGLCLRSGSERSAASDYRLISWPAVILSNRNFWSELEPELSRLRRTETETDLKSASWRLDVSFANCQGRCQQRGLSGILPGIHAPGGVLECWDGPDHRLALAVLGPNQTGFSYCSSYEFNLNLTLELESALFWERLGLVLGLTLNPSELSFEPVCLCPPQLAIQDRELKLTVASASMLPESLLQQGQLWLLIQTLGRWLGEELIVIDQLGTDLDSYWRKTSSALASLSKNHKYLRFRL